MDEIYADRLEALNRGGARAVAALMERIPLIADAVAGEGPLAVWIGPAGSLGRSGSGISDLPSMASLVAADLTRQVTMMSITRIEHQLLGLAAWHGGVLTREQTLEETGADPAMLDQAAAGLADLLLSDPQRAWVALRPGVEEWVWLPGRTVRRGAEGITSEAIAHILKNLGVEVGSRKWERVAAWEQAVRDGSVVEAIIARLPSEERRIFSDLARFGISPTINFGIGYYSDSGPRTPLHALVSSGLVGVDPYERLCWVWLDVIVAMRDGLFDDWIAPATHPRPVAGNGAPAIPGVVGRLEKLLDLWATAPPKALKSGGLGVTPIRAAAKALGFPSSEAGLLASLSIELGLLAPVVVATQGRGRYQTVDKEWRPTTERGAWRPAPAWERWARLVQQWLGSHQLSVSGKPIERYEWDSPRLTRPLVRHLYLRFLLGLEEGTGLEPTELAAELCFEHWGLLAPSIVEQLTDEARALGLVAADGPVGPTPIARLLGLGIEELERLATAGSERFTVQADHTVIAPPDLAADVAATLESFARLESDAGARTYRITEGDVTRALAAGTEAEEILAFLTTHSVVPVAQNVERSIHDVAARQGRVMIGNAATWLSCDDPALLARAVAVKAAKLEMLGPTVAVSLLPRHKVLQALQAKGLAAVDQTGPPSAPAPHPVTVRNGTRAELRRRPLRSDQDLGALAAAVAANPGMAADGHRLDGMDWDEELLGLLEEEA